MPVSRFTEARSRARSMAFPALLLALSIGAPAARAAGGDVVEQARGHGAYGAIYDVRSKVRVKGGPQRRKLVEKRYVSGDVGPASADSAAKEGATLVRLSRVRGIPRFAGVVDRADGIPALRMTKAPGVTADEWQKTAHPSTDDLVRAMERVAFIVDGAHAEGVLHLDLKPQNVMIDARRNGSLRVSLVDWGGAGAPGSVGFEGTPMFQAPEHYYGEPRSIRSDVYSMAASLFTLVTGAALTKEAKRYDSLRTHELRKIPDEDLRRIVDKATAIDPGARFATAAELGRALRAWRQRNEPRARARLERLLAASR